MTVINVISQMHHAVDQNSNIIFNMVQTKLMLFFIIPVIYCYMWYVSFSFFANLREESERGAYTKDPFRRQRI